jgi:hypothetical protein
LAWPTTIRYQPAVGTLIPLNRNVFADPAPIQPTYRPPDAAASLTTTAVPPSVFVAASAWWVVMVVLAAATSRWSRFTASRSSDA